MALEYSLFARAVAVDDLCHLWKPPPEDISDGPVFELSQMLLVDWIYGYFLSVVGRLDHGDAFGIVVPPDVERRAVGGCEVVELDFRVVDQINPDLGPSVS